ncbi:calcium-dependent cysteine-type endopeptidase [Rhodotorula toruloides]|uniref:Calcium-dependent cysteine-type endopeptidase n=1 Tax=Rhodotorula toruloides TaxID=5286 RepID=A0A511K718_RHOTO|nr:calcium-dependent cysteine-type endopeptidase [Rhodotorula toruloides]
MAEQTTQEGWAAKYQEAQATGTRATKLELAGSYDAAFAAYVSAAQTYLFLIRHTSDGETKQKLRAVSSRLVERAERIKLARKKGIRPVQRDVLSLEEQDAVLENGSLVNGLQLARWKASEGVSPYDLPLPPLSLALLTDPRRLPQPPLSLAQQAQGCTYHKFTETLPGAKLFDDRIREHDIVQDNVSDCSVVAALIVAAAHHAKFGSKLAFSCLYPQDPSGLPVESPDGTYRACLLANGVWRAVRKSLDAPRLDLLSLSPVGHAAIDDELPATADGRPSFACTRNRDQLWPALVEKAYLTMMGGYDFAGSNSANDLYALSGWIPEYISLRVIETLAHLQLAQANILEEAGRRELVLINPWRSNEPAEPLGTDSWSAGLPRALASGDGPATLVVDWDTLPALFASLHVNWDPKSFVNSCTVHVSAPPPSCVSTSTKTTNRHAISLRLKVSASPSAPSEVWLLAARHTSHPLEKGESMGVSVSRPVGGSIGGARLKLDDASFLSDNLYDLYRFLPEHGVDTYDLVVAHEGASSDFAVTLSAFSNGQIAFAAGSPPLPYACEIRGAWTTSTAGGNHTCHTFLNNPQYTLKLSPPPGSTSRTAELHVVAETDKDSPINARVVFGEGERVDRRVLEDRDKLAGDASYSYGRSSCSSTSVAAGSYTLVISSFQPQHLADFSISVKSTFVIEISPIPPEGAGMYARQAKGCWRPGEDGGSKDVLRNPRFRLRPEKAANVRIRLQTPGEPKLVSLSVYLAGPDGEAGETIATSGAYADYPCGVVTPFFRLEPREHGYLVMPSTYQGATHVPFQLLLYADAPVSFAPISR